jgi:hypothetical protein
MTNEHRQELEDDLKFMMGVKSGEIK